MGWSISPLSESFPIIERISGAWSAVGVFQHLACRPHCLFLDSALAHPDAGRWSFLAADPVAWYEAPADTPDPLDALDRSLSRWAACAAPVGCVSDPTVLSDFPPFQGGWAGLFAYELGRSFERLPRPRYDEFAVPAVAAGLYDVVIAFDHAAGLGWIISQGLPEIEPHRRLKRAAERIRQVRAWIECGETRTSDGTTLAGTPVAPGDLAPQFPAGKRLTSDFSREGYLRAVERAIELIAAGDIFQVNLSQRLLHPADDDPVSLYLRLRERNPAPLAGYFDVGRFQILSASPERFLRVAGRHVDTRPIKGTRRRLGQPEADARAAEELQRSEKDRAENVMIVDLLRNDLTRVCRPASVRVTSVCELETFAHVFHLVSTVEGELREGRGPLDLVRAAMPGGSITGAPKIRAMEVIAELEPTARGAYCGALGYLGLNGNMDLSILIRTITAGRGWWQLPVGGGIVADSDPHREYQETWDKAEGMLRAL